MIHVTIDKKVQSVLRVGVLEVAGMEMPADNGDQIWSLFCSLSDALHVAHAGRNLAEIAGVQDARRLYRTIGIDPTRTRPSSEALLRRSIKGKGVYRVHPLVDILNYVSLKQLMPLGLYDVSRIQGDSVHVQLGEDGWGFDGIRKDRVNVAGRLCVVDAAGPFGSPTSDSLRTAIDGVVSNALVLLYQTRTGEAEFLEASLSLSRSVLVDPLGLGPSGQPAVASISELPALIP